MEQLAQGRIDVAVEGITEPRPRYVGVLDVEPDGAPRSTLAGGPRLALDRLRRGRVEQRLLQVIEPARECFGAVEACPNIVDRPCQNAVVDLRGHPVDEDSCGGHDGVARAVHEYEHGAAVGGDPPLAGPLDGVDRRGLGHTPHERHQEGHGLAPPPTDPGGLAFAARPRHRLAQVREDGLVPVVAPHNVQWREEVLRSAAAPAPPPLKGVRVDEQHRLLAVHRCARRGIRRLGRRHPADPMHGKVEHLDGGYGRVHGPSMTRAAAPASGAAAHCG